MKQAMADVIEFMRAMGQEVPERPTSDISERTKDLRMGLIIEEMEELRLAMWHGYDLLDSDIEGVADACADLIYVTIGCAAAYGIDLAEVWRRVHAANLRKLDGPVLPSGKKGKPLDWVPPDVLGAIATQKPLSELYPTTKEGR